MDREEIVGEGLLSVAEAARFLGLSRSKLYNLMECGDLGCTLHAFGYSLATKCLLERSGCMSAPSEILVGSGT